MGPLCRLWAMLNDQRGWVSVGVVHGAMGGSRRLDEVGALPSTMRWLMAEAGARSAGQESP